MKNTFDKNMEILSSKMKKRLRVSSPELDILPSMKKISIQQPMTEDEEYDLAMKELRSLVKNRVNTHLASKKEEMHVDTNTNRKRERLELESLIDDAFDKSSKKMQS